jgi:hypothetical protein
MQTSPTTTTPPSPAVLDEHVLRANRALRDVQAPLTAITRTIANLVSDAPSVPVPADWCTNYRELRAAEVYAHGVFQQAAARARQATS